MGNTTDQRPNGQIGDGATTPTPRHKQLTMVEGGQLALVRRRQGKGFAYFQADGRRITDRPTLDRIRALAIPPAYEDVRIAADERAHIQAIGRDEAGRIQHRYHVDWVEVREERKIERLARLVAVLPKIRSAVERDLASRRLDRKKAVACAVALIDASHIRIGCEAYAAANGSHGAATLFKRHVEVKGSRISLRFRGKGGKSVTCMVHEPRLARALARIAQLPGRRLLQYATAAGRAQPISAGEVNDYLRRVAGEQVTAKDLRTLAASASAAEQLVTVDPAGSETGRRRQLAAVMRAVSEQLANTPAVVRKSYVHAVVVQAFTTGALRRAHKTARARKGRRRIEAAVGRLVARLRRPA